MKRADGASVECLIVGAGPAGLRAALDLMRQGRSVHGGEVCGRAKGLWHEGMPLREIGVPGSDLRAFEPSVVYVDGSERSELGWWPTSGTRVPSVVLAGDCLDHPSIEGAIVSSSKAVRVAAGALSRST